MKKSFITVLVLALCLISCNNKNNTVTSTPSVEEFSEESVREESTVVEKSNKEKSNKEKIIDAMREAAEAYREASSEEELKQIEAALKTKISAIQENCTVKELREINQDEEYNQVWKECMQAVEKTAESLGLF